MKTLIIASVMGVAGAGLWGYNMGSIVPILTNDNITVGRNYKEVECNDIIRDESGALVCEINMQAEDDNLRIFKGE